MPAKLIQVIVTDMEPRGDGTAGSAYRRLTQYWAPEGELLAEVDPCPPPVVDRTLFCETIALMGALAKLREVAQPAFYAKVEAIVRAEQQED